jgi:hypothetical protein
MPSFRIQAEGLNPFAFFELKMSHAEIRRRVAHNIGIEIPHA